MWSMSCELSLNSLGIYYNTPRISHSRLNSSRTVVKYYPRKRGHIFVSIAYFAHTSFFRFSTYQYTRYNTTSKINVSQICTPIFIYIKASHALRYIAHHRNKPISSRYHLTRDNSPPMRTVQLCTALMTVQLVYFSRYQVY